VGKKNPARFLPADPESPCEGCDKVRQTCRFCEKCRECCECYLAICDHCGGYDPTYCVAESDVARDCGHECHCEPCTHCGRTFDLDTECGGLAQNPKGGCDLAYCVRCEKKIKGD
jgi:hypothetical protein